MHYAVPYLVQSLPQTPCRLVYTRPVVPKVLLCPRYRICTIPTRHTDTAAHLDAARSIAWEATPASKRHNGNPEYIMTETESLCREAALAFTFWDFECVCCDSFRLKLYWTVYLGILKGSVTQGCLN